MERRTQAGRRNGRLSKRLLSLPAVVALLGSCDLSTGLKAYRDVSWKLAEVDGEAWDPLYSVHDLGAYSYTDPSGFLIDCSLRMRASPLTTWGWVEEAGSGRIRARIPQRYDDPPYSMFHISLSSECAGHPDEQPRWSLDSYVLTHHELAEPVVRIPETQLRRGLLSVGAEHHYGTPPEELRRWVTVDLPTELTLEERMEVPLTMTLRHWNGWGGTELLAGFSRTVTLVFRRHEEVNERGSP